MNSLTGDIYRFRCHICNHEWTGSSNDSVPCPNCKAALKKLTDEERNWIIWSLGFVSGAYSERNTGTDKNQMVEKRCLEIALKVQEL